MFRRLLAILVLGGLLYVAWHYSRMVEHDEDLVATIVFDDAGHLKKGTPVLAGGSKIGEVSGVSPVGTKTAVTVEIPLDQRNRIFSDSVFEIREDPVAIHVLSTISVGPPLENGAVVVARKDRISKLLAKGGEKLAPHLASARDKAFDMIGEYDVDMFKKQLEEWEAQVPEWKEEGKDVLADNVEDLEHTVGEIESALRKVSRDVEADKIRKAFDSWVEDLHRDE